MSRPGFSARAEEDLAALADYIAADNPRAAEQLVLKIRAKCRLYAKFPLLGRGAEHLGAGLRYFPQGQYLVFYRASADGIHVARVIHGARNLTAALVGEGGHED